MPMMTPRTSTDGGSPESPTGRPREPGRRGVAAAPAGCPAWEGRPHPARKRDTHGCRRYPIGRFATGVPHRSRDGRAIRNGRSPTAACGGRSPEATASVRTDSPPRPRPQHRACDPFDRPSTTGSLPPRYTLSESAFLSNAAVPFPRTPHPIRSFPDPGNQKNSPGSKTAHPAYPPGAPPWPEPPTAGRPASIQQFSFSSSKVREDYPCKPILHGYLRKAPGERLPATVSCL